MAIGNINAKIVYRMTKMCVVDSQSQQPFMVACLLKAVSLRGSTLYFNAIPSVFCKCTLMGASYPHPGVRRPHGQTIFMFSLSLLVLCIAYFSYVTMTLDPHHQMCRRKS